MTVTLCSGTILQVCFDYPSSGTERRRERSKKDVLRCNEEGQEQVKASYRDNYERLATIKRTYDPTNFFRVNQNIPPMH